MFFSLSAFLRGMRSPSVIAICNLPVAFEGSSTLPFVVESKRKTSFGSISRLSVYLIVVVRALPGILTTKSSVSAADWDFACDDCCAGIARDDRCVGAAPMFPHRIAADRKNGTVKGDNAKKVRFARVRSHLAFLYSTKAE